MNVALNTQPTRVLIIEDDPTLVMFLTRAMRRAGFDVASSTRGDAGLAAALTGKFDVVVLDWHIPAMDGLEIIVAMRAARCSTRILMLSGSGDFVRHEALAAGANDFLEKPCGMDELIRAVARLATGAAHGTPGSRAA